MNKIIYTIAQIENLWGHTCEEWGFDREALDGTVEAYDEEGRGQTYVRLDVVFVGGETAPLASPPRWMGVQDQLRWAGLPTVDAFGCDVPQVAEANKARGKRADDFKKEYHARR